MAEPMIARLGELAVKAEATKGTKETVLFDGTDSKFRVFNLSVTPEPTIYERNTHERTLSRRSHAVAMTPMRMSFEIELRKTAVTGTQDAWGPLLEACGMSFTSGTGTYARSDALASHKSLTMYAFLGSDGATATRIGMRGAVGKVRFVGQVGQPMRMFFEFMGTHDPGDATLATQNDPLNAITHEAAIPAMFHGVNFTYAGTTLRLSSVEVDLGNDVVPCESVNHAGGVEAYAIVDSSPTVKINPEVVPVATRNILADLYAGTEVALAWSIAQASAGGVNARTLAFSVPKYQLTSVGLTEVNKKLVFSCDGAANMSSAPGDEFTIAITGV